MVNAPKKNFSPLPAGQYGKSTNRSPQWYHSVNELKSGLDAERVRTLGALPSLRSKKRLLAEKRKQTNFLSSEEQEQWIDDYVERQTAVARKRVEDAETAIKQVQEHIRKAENAGLTVTTPEKLFLERLNAIGESLGDLRSSDKQQDGDDDKADEDAELGKPSEHNEPGWVMGTIYNTVQDRMERFWQKQIRLDKLTQPGLGDVADYFRERESNYGTAELKIPGVVKPHWNKLTAAPAPTTYAELMVTLDIIPIISQMPQGTSRPRSNQMRLGSGKPQSPKHIPSLPPDMERNSSVIQKMKPLEPVTLYPCTLPRKLITI